jgi:8-oxo-dGTP pyrophosphatase MutT (NUDIX family)
VADSSANFATPRVAAGVLFNDDDGRVLLVNPTYKKGWEIPGGYVEIGESPRTAAIREVKEELGLDIDVRTLLVLDWAPHPNEGDKLLIIFDGGTLSQDQLEGIVFEDGELSAARFFSPDELFDVLPDRLAKRVIRAARGTQSRFLEHGEEPGQ